MKILVTGIAGFIGYHTAKQLLARGDHVVGIDNLNDYYDVCLKKARLAQLGLSLDSLDDDLDDNPGEHCGDHCRENDLGDDLADADSADSASQQAINHGGVTFVKLDITDAKALSALFDTHRFDAVCHLAAQPGVRYSLENPMVYINSNVVGFVNILENCRHYGVNNLCFASSSSIYGLNQSQPFRTGDHTDHPVSLYAATKKANEMMAHTYAHLFGVRATGLRFFTVYGPWGRPDMAPMLFAEAMTNGRPIKVFNHGKMSRDFTYIDDVVRGIIGVIDSPAEPDVHFDPGNPTPTSSSAPYTVYNIGNNSPVSLMDFIETLEKAFATTAEKIMVDMQAGDVASTYADSSALHEKLGFAPSTDLQTGIAAFAKWYKNDYHSQ